MSYRSSIFSFSTLAGSPWPTRAFLLALVIVVAVRVALGLLGDRMTAIPGETADRRFFGVEDRIRYYDLQSRVLLMGSSFCYYGLHAPTFALAANMPEGDVANLAVSGGTAFEARKLLERNPRVTERAKLLVIDLTRSQLHGGNEIRPLFYRLADIDDRLTLDTRAERNRAMVDVALLNLREKRSVDHWLQGSFNMATGRRFVPKSPLPPRPYWSMSKEQLADRLRRFEPVATARRQLGGFFESPVMPAFMDKLMRLCKERSLRVVVLCTPKMEAYRAAFPDIPGALEADKAYFDWLDRLKPEAGVLVYDKPGAVDLTTDDFMDYGHLTEHGAKQLTRTLVRDLKARGLLPLK